MTQAFKPSANLYARAAITVGIGILVAACVTPYGFIRSSYMTRRGLVRDQPVPFSHKHHVDGVGLDCRYCHPSAESSAFAGVPATSVCMNCHTQIWSDSPMLAPVRESYETGIPLRWTRVHDLPDFVYFNHAIHVNKGIGCTTCHGQVDQMPLMYQEKDLFMKWCLECHREPQKQIRPVDEVFSVDYRPPDDQNEVGPALVRAYHIRNEGLTDCYTCHR